MRRLPPLNAVKAFEAVARLGSLSLAARELGVTPGAISQQVKGLEDYFGKRLFTRHQNRLKLTDAGLSVFADSTEIIDRLSAMTERLFTGGARGRFVVSALPSVAVRWLNGAFGRFLAAHPQVRGELRVEEDPVDFTRDHIDLRISYGEHLYPEQVTESLVRDEVTPLCTPAFWAKAKLDRKNPLGIGDEQMIHIDWGASFASYPTWAEWFRAQGLDRQPRIDVGHKAHLSSLAIDLALADAGIALGQKLLARAELDRGDLIQPFPLALPLAHAYCAVHPHSKAESRTLRQFLTSLRRDLA